MSGRIVETEAYPVGALRARVPQTPRNRSLFLPHGRVRHFTYGSCFMNVSSEASVSVQVF